MIKYGLYILLFLSFVCCTQTIKPIVERSSTEKPVRIANDSLSYEVIVFDQGFNLFLDATAQPKGFHSLFFLENQNQNKITTYNIRANQPSKFGSLYPQPIDYNSLISYGYEVNYLLFNYLLFFEQKYYQSL